MDKERRNWVTKKLAKRLIEYYDIEYSMGASHVLKPEYQIIDDVIDLMVEFNSLSWIRRKDELPDKE